MVNAPNVIPKLTYFSEYIGFCNVVFGWDILDKVYDVKEDTDTGILLEFPPTRKTSSVYQ